MWQTAPGAISLAGKTSTRYLLRQLLPHLGIQTKPYMSINFFRLIHKDPVKIFCLEELCPNFIDQDLYLLAFQHSNFAYEFL